MRCYCQATCVSTRSRNLWLSTNLIHYGEYSVVSKLSGARNQGCESIRPKGGSGGPSSRNGCGAPGNHADGFTSWGPLGSLLGPPGGLLGQRARNGLGSGRPGSIRPDADALRMTTAGAVAVHGMPRRRRHRGHQCACRWPRRALETTEPFFYRFRLAVSLPVPSPFFCRFRRRLFFPVPAPAPFPEPFFVVFSGDRHGGHRQERRG